MKEVEILTLEQESMENEHEYSNSKYPDFHVKHLPNF